LKTADISDILIVVQSLTITVTVTFCHVFSDGKAIALPIRYGCFCISQNTVTGTQRGSRVGNVSVKLKLNTNLYSAIKSEDSEALGGGTEQPEGVW